MTRTSAGRVGRARCRPLPSTERPDHIAAGVVILDDGPDDDEVSALRGLHFGAVQGGCDLEDAVMDKPDTAYRTPGRTSVATEGCRTTTMSPSTPRRDHAHASHCPAGDGLVDPAAPYATTDFRARRRPQASKRLVRRAASWGRSQFLTRPRMVPRRPQPRLLRR
jgi:hypothetical protein